jgi:hypothetical protein
VWGGRFGLATPQPAERFQVYTESDLPDDGGVMTRRLTLLLALSACKPAPAAPPKPPVPMVEREVRPRKGIETRANAPASAPLRGLLLDSYGLVNETFSINADLDAKTITRVTKYAKDGSEVKASRALTDAEAAELLQAREKVWRDWVELPKNPAAEYQEHLYLLDVEAVGHVGAQGGFPETGVAGALAHRLQALAPRR